MGGKNRNRKHPHHATTPAGTNTGGGQPDPPTRLLAVQKDVLAVAFGTALRAYDLRCDASGVALGSVLFCYPQLLAGLLMAANSSLPPAGPAV